ncbi:hypothetical protein [Mycolicibacterium komossense]|uniref:Secreted protein n=1 Tax=Mycolicibacterium komossense TaxID=1779 RepID=A0ABT3CEK4_9MYCO|nr:hypothetical protein [Mycolicibacterium komossense]MCV7227857.1 hypothetical protein [Mycolicibacterium komossense]
MLLLAFGWVAIAAAGIVRADDDDDDDDDDDIRSRNSPTSSKVIDVWPSADLAWPPELGDTSIDSDSEKGPPIVLPGEWQPGELSSMPATPSETTSPPIVPVPSEIAP